MPTPDFKNHLGSTRCNATGREDAGIALLSVVVVLSTLLVVGVLFAVTVNLDLRASRYYRDAGQAEQIALEGLARAVAEIQYDMWGVQEKRAFLLADSTQTLSDAAYARISGSGSTPIVTPKSRWRRTVEKIGPHQVLTDYRWVWEAPEGETYAADANKRYTHAGGVYHDEFLPEGVDNSDAWEMGLHFNRGDIYFEGEPPRRYRWDKNTTDPKLFNPTDTRPGVQPWFWSRDKNRPWDRDWDYVDTRINGDSFYKIFRSELLDPALRRSSYAGVQDRISAMPGEPMRKTLWRSMKTHLGVTFGGDPRGGAVNVNQVNNNYAFEIYYAQQHPGEPDPNRNPYVPFHYKDSKWVYVYDEGAAVKRGRYAVMVWPDSGFPNANYVPDITEMAASKNMSFFIWGSIMRGETFFNLLDTVPSPRGGPLTKGSKASHADLYGANYANIIISDRIKGGGNEIKKWSRDLCKRIDDHVDEVGPMTSRAELNMLLRKDGFAETNFFGQKVSQSELERDAELLSSLLSVHAYENFMGPHWETDRIVLDWLGNTDTDYVSPRTAYRPNLKYIELDRDPFPTSSKTAFTYPDFAATSKSRRTREMIWQTLDNLKFYWGPDALREGQLTPFTSQDGKQKAGVDSGSPAEGLATKSQFFGYLLAGAYFSHPDSPSYQVDARSSKDVTFAKLPRDLSAARAGNTHSSPFFPQINEVGRLDAATVSRLKKDLENCQAPGRDELAKLAAASGGALHFIEFIDQRPIWTAAPLFRNRPANYGAGGYATKLHVPDYEVRVGGTNILGGAQACIVCVDNTYNGKTSVRPWSAGGEVSDFPGQWASDRPKVMSEATFQAGLEKDYDMLFTGEILWRNRDGGGRLGPAKTPMKESVGEYVPGRYVLVVFSSSINADEISVVRKADGAVMDYVKLPGPLSRGYSCYDPLHNQHPEMWMNTGNQLYDAQANTGLATPAWRSRAPYKSNHVIGDAPTWATRSSDNQAWYHGMNRNYYATYYPGAETWTNPRSPALPGRYAVVDVVGKGSDPTDPKYSGVSGLRGCNHDDSSWVANGRQSLYKVFDLGTDGINLRHLGHFVKVPLAFFPRDISTVARAGSVLGGVLTPKMPDPFLRYWGDLMRVAPFERYFVTGWTRGDARTHLDRIIWDTFDNNLDGHVDDMVAEARNPGADFYQNVVGHSRAHYLGDRTAIGRINVNEIQHPAVVFYCGIGAVHDEWGKSGVDDYDYQTIAFGKKPFKGYTNWMDVLSRTGLDHPGFARNNAPYHLAFWYENQFADVDTLHTHNSQSSFHNHHVLNPAALKVYAGNSAVYTVYVTAQTLDDRERALAEIKIRCTLERTWDGKTNLLDFKWVPSDVTNSAL